MNFFWFAKQHDLDRDFVFAQTARDDESIAAVVAPPAQNDDVHLFAADDHAQQGVASSTACVFHELQAGNAMAFDGEPVDFAHFRCGECFHEREEMRLQHPAAADV